MFCRLQVDGVTWSDDGGLMDGGLCAGWGFDGWVEKGRRVDSAPADCNV